MTDAEIEALAVKHEAFGFGRVDDKGYTTHGFDPDGLAAFARDIAEEAVRVERERSAAMRAAIQAALDYLRRPADEITSGYHYGEIMAISTSLTR